MLIQKERNTAMRKTGTAFFVDDPRVWEDLLRPHLLEQEKPFEIVRTITLECIDFENFITDMLVARGYLENPDEQSFRSQKWQCFFRASAGPYGRRTRHAGQRRLRRVGRLASGGQGTAVNGKGMKRTDSKPLDGCFRVGSAFSWIEGNYWDSVCAIMIPERAE